MYNSIHNAHKLIMARTLPTVTRYYDTFAQYSSDIHQELIDTSHLKISSIITPSDIVTQPHSTEQMNEGSVPDRVETSTAHFVNPPTNVAAPFKRRRISFSKKF